MEQREELRKVSGKVTEMHEALVGTMEKEGFIGQTNRRLEKHERLLSGLQKFTWAAVGVSLAVIIRAIFGIL